MPELPDRSISFHSDMIDHNKCSQQPTVNSPSLVIVQILHRLVSLIKWVKKPKSYGAYLQLNQKPAQLILHAMYMAGQ